ncbi:tyrosine-protein phosphatase non-receptor type 12-like isoform X4 [Saccostrea echinata]|uniref:tyrosine-protein phosphatase non-receptor type 12-like isoform X4 n=1 Tax=Saccostrea echinata TaxID=191078 RepID=UPI002A7EF322|nr:tyrosine-protein phosphatase non-receptor type 12-like isoform X4 [Saccostrea echinata]
MDEPAKKLRQALEKFITHVDDLIEEEDPAGNGFNREYRELRELAAHHKEQDTFPANWGKQPYNTKKNRYRDIVPFDDSRVILEEIEGEEGSDYINASYILNIHNNDAYIASQGPLPTTVDDFWRMIWEQKVRVILMACKEVEMGKKKCAKYWPSSKEEDEQYGTINVHLQEEFWLADDCVERTLEVKRGGQSDRRIVTQFQYTGWPDHGIPDDIDVILTMIAKMREIRSHDKNFAPVVVHCSAGCGRTGTICAVDYAWDVLKCGRLDCDFDLNEIVKKMREQRQSMIQTPDQYEMAHRCVRELFQQHIEALDGNIYANFEPQPGHDEYYNVELDGHTDPNREVDPYEMVGMNQNQAAFTVSESPRPSNVVSILERDALQTVDMYSTPEAFEEALQDLKKAAESAPRRTSYPKPELKPKPVFIPESKEGVTPTGYENICDDGKYENMNKSDHLTFHHEEKSPKIPRKDKPVLIPKPEEPLKTVGSGPVFVDSRKSGPQFANNKPSGPVFHQSLTSKTGPQFEVSSNNGNSFPPPVSSRAVPQFESPANRKSDHQESNHAKSGPQISQQPMGPVFDSSDPSKPKVTHRQTSSGPKNKTVITVSSNPRISYVNNEIMEGKTKSAVNPSRNSNGLPLANDELYDKAKPVPDSPTRSSQEPAVYSQVNKTDTFSRSFGPTMNRFESTYETITGESYSKRSSDSKIGASMKSNIYSEVDPRSMDSSSAPPIPNRGYKEDEPKAQLPSHTIHGLTTLERKSGLSRRRTNYVEIDMDYNVLTKRAGLFKGNNALSNLKHNIKDKLNIGSNTEELHVIPTNVVKNRIRTWGQIPVTSQGLTQDSTKSLVDQKKSQIFGRKS